MAICSIRDDEGWAVERRTWSGLSANIRTTVSSIGRVGWSRRNVYRWLGGRTLGGSTRLSWAALTGEEVQTWVGASTAIAVAVIHTNDCRKPFCPAAASLVGVLVRRGEGGVEGKDGREEKRGRILL